MSEYLGKAYVRAHYPQATFQWSLDGCTIIDIGSDEFDVLGRGNSPEEAWHDAALEIDREGP